MSSDPTGEVQRFHDALERAGLAPRWTGSGGESRCPAHDDARASLSYGEGREGRLLARCHAGCEFKAIVDALGFEPARDAARETRKDGQARREVTSYQYRDERGELLFEVVRYAPKDFRVRRPDGAGGWVWSVKGVRDVLYNLASVLEATAQGRTVYLVEGEKDADAMRARGLSATTNRGGANKWHPEHARVLAKAARVVILPDNDDPGRAHARKAAESVRGAGGKDVRVVELPGLPQKGDVSDWFAAGGTPEQLDKLAESWTQPDPPPTPAGAPSDNDPGGGLSVVRGAVRVAAHMQRGGKSAVELTAGDIALVDLVNLVSQADRERFAAQVPDAHRAEALEALAELGRRVARQRPAAEVKAGAGQELELPDAEPWPHAVLPGDLLANLVLLVKRYVSTTPEACLAVSLWALLTHVHDAFDVSPILCITSPEKQCGKTRLLTLLGAVVRRPLGCASITSAAVFRTVELCQPTLLLDEADKRFDNDEELRVIYNSGWTRGSASAVRIVGKDAPKPMRFSTWCPKAIALIGDLPGTLQDRSIIVRLRRRLEHEHVDRLRADRIAGETAALVQQMARVARDYAAELSELDPEAPAGLSDRAADNWRPLFAVAAVCGGQWLAAARKAASALSGIDPTAGEGPRLELLRDLEAVLRDDPRDRIPSTGLRELLLALPESRWKEWNRGRGLTTQGMAKLLKPYGIEPRHMRAGVDDFRGYARAEILVEAGRYLRHASGILGAEPSQVSQPALDAGNRDFPKCHREGAVTDAIVGESPRNSRAVTDVTLETPEFGRGEGLPVASTPSAQSLGATPGPFVNSAQPFADASGGARS